MTAIKLYQLGREPEEKAPEQFQAVPEGSLSCWENCAETSECEVGLVCGMGWCKGPECPDIMRCYNERCPTDDTCCPRMPPFVPTPTGGVVDPRCVLEFGLATTGTPPTGTLTPTPTLPTLTITPTPSLTPPPGVTYTPTPTPTSVLGCWDTCTPSTGCTEGLSCQTVNGTYRCVNPSCPLETDCICPSASEATPTPVPQLPEAGFNLPTFGALLTGAVLLITSLILLF